MIHLSTRAEKFLERISTGEIPKRFLTNHGKDYTDGPEEIALLRFDHYIVSCGYKLLHHRLDQEERGYCGY